MIIFCGFFQVFLIANLYLWSLIRSYHFFKKNLFILVYNTSSDPLKYLTGKTDDTFLINRKM